LSLAQQLRPLLPARARGRGNDTVEFVVIDDHDPLQVRATVHGRESQEILLRLTPPAAWSVSCTCPLFKKTGACRHLWAVVKEVDERGLDIVSTVNLEADEPSLDTLDPTREVWRGRLGSVHSELEQDAPDPWDGLVPNRVRAGYQFLYVLDLDDTASGRGLVLRPFWRERHRNHRWSRRRPYDPEAEDAVELSDPTDVRIFRALRAARRSAWTASSHLSSFGGSGAWWLDEAEAAEVIPLLCETGRAYLHAGGEEEAEPLQLDSDEPWAFGVRLERDEDTPRASLHGYLARRDETQDIEDPLFVLEAGFLFLPHLVAPMDARGAWPLLKTLRTDGPLTGPLEDAGDLAQRVIDLSGHPLLSGEGLHLAEPRTPYPHLRISAPAAERAPLTCQIQFQYGDTFVDLGEARGAVREKETGLVIRRVWHDERDALRSFLLAGGRPAPEGDGISGRVDAADLDEVVLRLTGLNWSVEVGGELCKTGGALTLRVSSGMDWFDLEGEVDFDGSLVPISHLLTALEKGDRSLTLEDGTIGYLPDELRRQWGVLSGLAVREGEGLRFHKSQGWLLDRLLAGKQGISWDEKFGQLRDTLSAFSGLAEEDEMESFQGDLRGYQRTGLGWFRFLRDVGFGGCLADDMGLGKTIQVLALLEDRHVNRGEHRPSLVVVPRSLMFNWRAEAQRFTPNLKVLDYTGPQRSEFLPLLAEQDVILTTYGTLRRDVHDLKDILFDYVILDEAQAIKNATSHSAKAARLLNSQNRLALSGTPVENHLGELWSLFEFLNPGMLGRARAFKGLISSRSEAGLDDAGRALLASTLSPFILRRTKEEVLPDLPPKVEQILWCELSGEQRDEYNSLREHYRSGLSTTEGKRDSFWVLTALLRLRQAACHPALVESDRIEELSAKLDVLLPHVDELVESGHKALIFSQFTSHLSVVRRHLDQAGHPYAYLDGKTRDREAVVSRFRDRPDCPLLLMSLKAGGLGLNLVEADYVFLLDPWWNPAAEAQAIDRAHRIGRTNKVMAYRLIARDTIEEKILELQDKKRALVKSVLPTGDGVLKSLSIDEIEALFA